MLALLPLLLSAAPLQASGPPEAGKWSGSFDASVTLITGNNESTTSTADLSSKYEAKGYRWILEGHYAGIRQTDKNTQDASSTARLYEVALEHHRFLDDEDNLYLYGKGSARSDIPNGLDIREDAGVGLGYTWRWNEDQTQLSAEGGPSALKENNVGVGGSNLAVNGRAAIRFETPLSKSWKLISRFEFFQSFDISEDRSSTGEMNVRWNIEENWFLQGTAAYAWDNTPAPTFEKTDWRYVLSVGFSF